MNNKTLGILAAMAAGVIGLYAWKNKTGAPTSISVGGTVFPYSVAGGIPYSATRPLDGGLGLPDGLISRNDDNIAITRGNCTETYVFGLRHVVCGPG